jgi:hypothetical protein
MSLMLGRPRKSKKSSVWQRTSSLKDQAVLRRADVVQEAIEAARQQLDRAAMQGRSQDLARRVGTLLDTTRTGLPPVTQDAAERARLVAERLREEGAVLSGDLTERLKADVAPVAKEWAQEALDEAEQILMAARQRAADLSTTARKDVAPELSTKAGAAAGLVAGTAVTAAQSLGKRVGEMSSSKPKKRVRAVRKRQASIQNRAGKAVGYAGQQTKHAIVETSLIFFWGAALGSVVYYALLSPSQRERVRGFFAGAMSQIRDVMSDFQGDDAEFGSRTV